MPLKQNLCPAAGWPMLEAPCRGHYLAHPPRRLLHRLVRIQRRLRCGWPGHCLVQGVKNRAVRALERDAVAPEASQKHAPLRRIKRKKVRPPQQIAPLRVLLLQSFRVLPEKPGRALIRSQFQARGQHEPLCFLVLVDGVVVCPPFRRERLGALSPKKLLQHFAPAKLPQHIRIQHRPVPSRFPAPGFPRVFARSGKAPDAKSAASKPAAFQTSRASPASRLPSAQTWKIADRSDREKSARP